MSIIGSSSTKLNQVGLTKGHQSLGITYQEPTYHLHLTPIKPALSPHLESFALKFPSYQSLDDLVDRTVRKRFQDQWETFSPNKQEKIRKEVAHSLMQRSDQKSSMKIQKSLAEAQGLTERAIQRLQNIVDHSTSKKSIDLTPLSDLLFSHHPSSIFPELLALTLTKILGSDPSLNPLKNKLFKELVTIQKEIQSWTDTTMIYIRLPQAFNGHSYINHLGETVMLSQTIPSSYDRDHPDVQNARLNLDSSGHVIYSTGRIETERKAHQVIDTLIHHTLTSGQISEHDLILQDDDSYLYPILIDNLINPSPIARLEREYLEQQDAVLKKLQGQVKRGRLKDGREVKLVLQPIHFSTHSNYNTFLGQGNGWTSTGSDLSEKISKEGVRSLDHIYQLRKASFTDPTQKAIEYCLDALSNEPTMRDRLILRAFICEMLNIPYHVNCKSSKDRTAVVVAIKKALHQWLGLEGWKNNGLLTISDPRQLLDNPLFREYSEAALFENLPMTDQGTGFSGELNGNQYTQNRGFDYRFSILENPLPALVLSDRYLHTTSTIARIFYALITPILSIMAVTIYIALSPIILTVLWIKFKDQAWQVAKYLFLCLLLFPTRSILRQKWINHDSLDLQQRSFFKTHHPKRTAPSLQALFDRIGNLSSDQQRNLIRFVQTADRSYLEPVQEHESILREITDNWLALQRRLKAKESLPSCLKAILEEAPSSPVVLFQYLKYFSQKFIFDQIERTHLSWPAENYVEEIIRHKIVDGPIPCTQLFQGDVPRTHYVVHGKHRTYDLPLQHEGDKICDLADALQGLSVFKGCQKIPFPIQETLSQKMVLSHVTCPIIQSINSMPINSNDRTFILEEGSDSFFWLTIKEKSVISNFELGCAEAISFEYSYTFKIAKLDEDQWSTNLVELSPVQTKLGKHFDDALLNPCHKTNPSDAIFKATCDALMNDFCCNLEAAALWTPETLLPIQAVQERLVSQLNILSTKFSSRFNTPSKKLYRAFEENFKKAETDAGKALIIQTFTSYLRLFKKNQINEMLIKQPTESIFSKLLKAALQEELSNPFSKQMSPEIISNSTAFKENTEDKGQDILHII